MPICLRLLAHVVRSAASRTFCTAGVSRAMSTAISTNSSINVKAGVRSSGRTGVMGTSWVRGTDGGMGGGGSGPPVSRERGYTEFKRAELVLALLDLDLKARFLGPSVATPEQVG